MAVADLSQESAERVDRQIAADGGRALPGALDIGDRTLIKTGQVLSVGGGFTMV